MNKKKRAKDRPYNTIINEQLEKLETQNNKIMKFTAQNFRTASKKMQKTLCGFFVAA